LAGYAKVSPLDIGIHLDLVFTACGKEAWLVRFVTGRSRGSGISSTSETQLPNVNAIRPGCRLVGEEASMAALQKLTFTELRPWFKK